MSGVQRSDGVIDGASEGAVHADPKVVAEADGGVDTIDTPDGDPASDLLPRPARAIIAARVARDLAVMSRT